MQAKINGVRAAVMFFLSAGITGYGEEDKTFPLVCGEVQAVIVSGGEGGDGSGGWRYEGRIWAPQGQSVAKGVGGGNILKTHIEKSTGRALNLVDESEYDPDTMPFAVFVGNTAKARELFGGKLQDMDSDGYVVHVTPEYIILAGNVEFAEYDFLRTHLGIESYIPTALFTVVPEHDRIRVPVETRVEIPVFYSRGFSNLNTGDRHEWIPWRSRPGQDRYRFHHNICSFITPAEFGESHPEYFAMDADGTRIVKPEVGRGLRTPCTSNPDVARVVIEKCRQFFDRHPATLSISLGMTDYGWCQCPDCKALDGPSLEVGGKTTPMSNRYYAFLNEVARGIRRTHPGRFIGTLGYAGADLPPTFPVERNIIVYMCYNRANWANPDEKSADMALIDAWSERLDRIGIYEYLYGGGFSVPRLYTRQLAEMLRHVGNNNPGSGFYAEIYSHHGLDGPKAWITDRLLWNPDLDVDGLMKEWTGALFGPAAEHMRKYFDELEETWMRNGARVRPGPHGSSRTALGETVSGHGGKFWGWSRRLPLEMYLPEDMTALRTLLDQAAAAAAGDELVMKRIAYFADSFDISETVVRQHHAHAATERMVADKAPVREVLAALLENDANAPELDFERLMKLIAEEPTRFSNNLGEPSIRAAEATLYIMEKGVQPVIRELLDAGRRDPAELARAGRDALLAMAPGNYGDCRHAAARMDKLQRLAGRIAVAGRATKAPAIDGVPDEDCRRWMKQDPWFQWKTTAPCPPRTDVAWAYDDDKLYIALRCRDQIGRPYDIGGASGYMCPAWRYPAVEIFISPDKADAGAEQPPYYQVIVTASGGLWETDQKAMTGYKTGNDGQDEWWAEIALDRKKMGMENLYDLRVNVVRTMRARYAYWDVGAWYVTIDNLRFPWARGRLIMEK